MGSPGTGSVSSTSDTSMGAEGSYIRNLMSGSVSASSVYELMEQDN